MAIATVGSGSPATSAWANSVAAQAATLSDAQTLTNKTLTAPKIDRLYDENGLCQVIRTAGVSGGVNYFEMDAAVAGGAPTIYAWGSDTNVNLNLRGKGSGKIQAYGVEVATISDIQTLTNKTLTNPKVNGTLYDANGVVLVSLTSQPSAINYPEFGNIPAGWDIVYGCNGASADIGMWLRPKGAGVLTHFVDSGSTATFANEGYATNIDCNITTKGTGKVKANSIEVATISDVQTLTNKTLTYPRMGTILDGSGNNVLSFGAVGGANWLQINNNTAGNTPALYSVGSDTNIDLYFAPKGTGKARVNGVEIATISDTQTLTNKTLTNPKINAICDDSGPTVLQFDAESGSSVNFFQMNAGNAGGSPVLYAAGSDTNLDLNLTPKGTGKVKANSVEVATISDTQTLTNKTLTNPTITNYTESVVAIGNSSTSQTIALTSGTVQTCTLTGHCTFTMPTATAGKSFTLLLKTGTGALSGTFTGVKWPTAGAPTITVAANKMDILTFIADGTNWYGSYTQGYTP